MYISYIYTVYMYVAIVMLQPLRLSPTAFPRRRMKQAGLHPKHIVCHGERSLGPPPSEQTITCPRMNAWALSYPLALCLDLNFSADEIHEADLQSSRCVQNIVFYPKLIGNPATIFARCRLHARVHSKACIVASDDDWNRPEQSNSACINRPSTAGDGETAPSKRLIVTFELMLGYE